MSTSNAARSDDPTGLDPGIPSTGQELRHTSAATKREQLSKSPKLTDFERIRDALVKGEDNDRLLDGHDFDHRYWINAKAALGRIERKLEVAERERDALRHSYDEALIDSLEHILFGDVQHRSRDELENRASEAICAWNERPA